MSIEIGLAESDLEIQKCYPVMSELRPHVSFENFVPQIKRQMKEGYKLAFLSDNGEIKALAGFRLAECLARGKYLYVDDLITTETSRSSGYGGKLFDWAVEYAKNAGCDSFLLDSGVQRFDAHRFYLNKKLKIDCHHFAMSLKDRKSS
jgi:GNAT superfamily N-acetyltransferase